MFNLKFVPLTPLALTLACGGPLGEDSVEEVQLGRLVHAGDLSALEEDGRLLLRLSEIGEAGIVFDQSRGPIDFSRITVIQNEHTSSGMNHWLEVVGRNTQLDLRAEPYFGLSFDSERASAVGTNAQGLSSAGDQPGASLPVIYGWQNCGTAPMCLLYLGEFRPMRICRCDRKHDRKGWLSRKRGFAFTENPDLLPALPSLGSPDPEPPEENTNAGGTTGGTTGGSGSDGSSSGGSSSGTSGSGSAAGSGGSQSAGGSVSGGGNAGGW